MEWISVDDGLPVHDMFVDVWCKSSARKDYGHRYANVLFMNGKFNDDKFAAPYYEFVSHWMQIKPPNETNKA